MKMWWIIIDISAGHFITVAISIILDFKMNYGRSGVRFSEKINMTAPMEISRHIKDLVAFVFSKMYCSIISQFILNNGRLQWLKYKLVF